VHLPPPRLVVIGAVHISQVLAPMARLAGFDMTIIDPRTAFATADRFSDVALIAEWLDDFSAEIEHVARRRSLEPKPAAALFEEADRALDVVILALIDGHRASGPA